MKIHNIGDKFQVPTMPKIGSISEFDPSVCDFKIYIERLRVLFDANSIEESKQVPVLLTLIGEKCYGVLRDLVSPDLPTSKTFDQIVTVLTNHYSPAKSEIAERFKFLRRRQGSGCLLYTSPSPRDKRQSRMPSSA